MSTHEPSWPTTTKAAASPGKPKLGRLAWPVIAWLLFLAWSNIPPYRMHINKVRWGDFAWHWRLWEQGGLGICEVRYFDMHREGAPIERWALFGYERPGKMTDALARTNAKQLWTEYARVCDALERAGDPSPNVEVYARCGRGLGWREVEHRRRNVCKHGKSKSKPKSGSQPSGSKK